MNKFTQGYACCVSTLIWMDGEANTQARELYVAGIGNKTEKQLRKEGVDQQDIDRFKKYGLLKA